MIPVAQTTFYDPTTPGGTARGNCVTAVVASLLELPIEAVPNFVQDHVEHDPDDEHDGGDWNWWRRLLAFVEEHGHQLARLRANPEHTGLRAPEPGEFYTVSGISPRDPSIHHIVIYQDGAMVWDPHPDGTGLAEIDDPWHWSLVPIKAEETS